MDETAAHKAEPGVRQSWLHSLPVRIVCVAAAILLVGSIARTATPTILLWLFGGVVIGTPVVLVWSISDKLGDKYRFWWSFAYWLLAANCIAAFLGMLFVGYGRYIPGLAELLSGPESQWGGPTIAILVLLYFHAAAVPSFPLLFVHALQVPASFNEKRRRRLRLLTLLALLIACLWMLLINQGEQDRIKQWRQRARGQVAAP